MSRFVIVNELPFLFHNGKTYAVRWDEKGFTVGPEVELTSVPTVTYSDISIKAKCRGHLDSIAVQQEPEQEVQDAQEPEQEVQDAVDLSSMTVPELKEYAASNGIDLGDARKKADILETIKNANAQDVIHNDSDG